MQTNLPDIKQSKNISSARESCLLGQTIILAAGRGSRMQDLTTTINKVMLKIPPDNKPMLLHTIENAKRAGLTEFIVVVGYQSDSIVDYFGDGSNFGVSIKYVAQPNIKGGTADALRVAKDYITTPKFVLVYGDVVPSPNTFKRLIVTGRFTDGIAVREVDDPSRYGVVDYNTDTLEVISIVEKSDTPPSNVINAGVYILSKEVLDYTTTTPLSDRGEYELTTTINDYVTDGNRIVVVPIASIQDIGTKQEYQTLITNKVNS